ncbi:MAG: molybdopterin-dependent oxidoreductase [Candidatus Marinimicrobia bacterium]|nr:molybdopterin-dependent oxidoreductase [Candidatus Neomarinimicrobiota bacterium]
MAEKSQKYKWIGKRTIRPDGVDKVTGRANFGADLMLPGMLVGKVLRSPHAHAGIKHIDTTRALALQGVAAVLTYQDFEPHYYTSAGQGYPEPSPRDMLVLDRTVRFVGDRVALVATETPEIALQALELIDVEYELLPAIFDLETAIGNQVIIHPEDGATGIHDARQNIAAHIEAQLGDVDRGLSDSTHVFEGRYATPYVQQAHIEPHITLTWLDADGRLVIRTSTQVPFHVRRIVAEVLDYPVRKIRVIKPRVGGAFGGKQEILNEELCAAVTLKTGRPARMEMTREEEFYAARSRHPMIVKLRIGVSKDATFNAIDMEILENSGAYGTHALTVMSVAAQKTLSLYKAPHLRVVGNSVYTNLSVAGAYRGYGATQGLFALEVMMDEIAQQLDIDPIELRLKNRYEEGDEIPIARILGEGREGFPLKLHSSGLRECLQLGRELSDWEVLRTGGGDSHLKRGIGVAAAAQGSGIPGIDMGSAMIKMNEDASFNLMVGATDIGTGSDTALAQIAAEVLEVPVSRMIVYSSDTDLTPFDTGAYASSTTFVSGGAVMKAAEKLRQRILEQGARLLGVDQAEIRAGQVVDGNGNRISYEEICTRSFYTDEQRQLMATASHLSYDSPPPLNATFADVTVDTETGLVTVNKIVSVTDAGQIINPQMAEGQAEGAIPQSLGMALSEYMQFDETGAPLHTDFNSYHIYTAIDMPEMVIRFVPGHEPNGPFGAKAVAEIPINAPAPAVANAIYNACGVRVRELPITPEKILDALESS